MLTDGSAQARNPDGSPAARHAAWKPHPMQGWSPDFIPKITGDAVAEKLFDQVVTIPGPDAHQEQPGSGAEGGHLRRHHLRRHVCRRRSRSRPRRRRARPSSACCPTPASATCRRRSLPTSRPT